MEQGTNQFFQDVPVTPEHLGDLFGIRLKPFRALLGLVENTADGDDVIRLDMEKLLEGVDLFTGDDTVGLGHFRRQHDHRRGEGDLLVFVIEFAGARFLVDHMMAGNGADYRAKRPADSEPGDPTDDFPPNAHVPCLIRR